MKNTNTCFILFFLITAFLVVAHVGCSSDEDRIIQCTTDDDCPSGYRCSNAGVCVEEEQSTDYMPPYDCNPGTPSGSVLYVSATGSDTSGSGSEANPFATITEALDNAEDGSTILVKAGTYSGRIRIRGTFTTGVTIRSETPYMAQLRHDAPVITCYTHTNGCSGITIEGFDIAHSGTGADPLVVHLDGDGSGAVSNITIRNNILHDSYDNDILKINNGISNITVERNLFYNQTGSDEHIDINSASDIIVQDNIFMNDFVGSTRTNSNDTSSYIVVKDSNGDGDMYTGSRNITIRRNIFLNWEGSTGSNFILLGEDGQDFYEAYNVTIENNLMIGNASNMMRAPFGIKGCRDIIFNNNTITGDLPSRAFAMRFNREGSNLINDDINMYNNIWSDYTGTMGAMGITNPSDPNDFSDTSEDDIDDFILDNNLYFNGGNIIPEDSNEKINKSDDLHAVVGDPNLGGQTNVVLPRLSQYTQLFSDGSSTICEVFSNLVQLYGTPGGNSPAIDSANADHVPVDDILGNLRGDAPDIGAVEVQ